MENLLILISVILFASFFIKAALKPRQDYHSHWSLLLSDFKFSTKEFYELVKKEITSHGVDRIYMGDVSLKTGNVVSSKRLYLRIMWQNYFYDLCFAPFGDGCFVSWWLIKTTSGGEEFLAAIPFIGEWLRRTFYRQTYYKIDTASMFMTYSHHSVLAVIDEITKGSGIRLTEDQRKPILNDVFKR